MSDIINERKRRMALYVEMARAGWRLFPLKPRSKIPAHKGWVNRVYGYEDIKEAVKRGHNVGVHIQPGQLVIDVDPRNGGMETLKWLLTLYELDLNVPIVLSGRGDGGMHLYYNVPRDRRLRTKLQSLPGIDFKSSGLVVAPGSLHPVTWKPYTLTTRGTTFSDATGSIPEALLKDLELPPAMASDVEPGEISTDMLEILLGALNPENYGPGKHDEWFALMCACHDATNGEGEDVFIEWCAQDSAYGESAMEMNRVRWRSLATKPHRYTYRTLLREVANAGRWDLLREVDRLLLAEESSAASDFEGI